MSTTPVLAYGTSTAAAAIAPAADEANLRAYRQLYDQLQGTIAAAERIATALRRAIGELVAANAPENVAHHARRSLEAAEQNVAALWRKEARILRLALEVGIDLELDADLR